MNETIKTILSRRSCRAFTEQAVSEDDVKMIVVSHGTLMRHCLNVSSVKNCEICKWE